MSSNAVPPSVTPPSPDEYPQNLILTITGITRDNQAKVTSVAHGFTSSDVGVTFIMFKQVVGMLPINGQNALIQSIVDADNFTVNITTTTYPIYRSGGVVIIDSSEPPSQQQGFQVFNTPFQNIGQTL